MDSINELELRRILKKKPSSADLLRHLVKVLLNPQKTWEEKWPLWHFLYRWGKLGTLAHTLADALNSKARVPFDLVIETAAQSHARPSSTAMEALLKGLRKQSASEDVIPARGWDKWDKRLPQLRRDVVGAKVKETRKAKEAMLDKFNFLRNQRLVEQAGRVLRRMIELYPEDKSFRKLKAEFDDQWARDIVASHVATLGDERLDRAVLITSPADQEMLKCFLEAGEKIAVEHREFASDLAVAFMFMSEYLMGLEILAWAPPVPANEWMRAEFLVLARRFVEALEHIKHLEMKFVEDPETSFAVSYLRAQCLRELGQKDTALEILRSIVRVRPNYRSAQALILEWTEGAGWE